MHQTHGYFQNIVAEDEVGKVFPDALDATFRVLARLQKGFAVI